MVLGIILAGLNIVDILNAAETSGVLKYVLPFLLVFALVFGILTNAKILGDNRGVHAIIAAAIGLLALYGDFLPNFLQDFAPNLAIGISILLAGIILLGLFYGEEAGKIKWIKNVLFGIGAAIFIVVAYSSLSSQGFTGSGLWDQYAPAVITLLIIIGVIALIIKNPAEKKP